VPPAIECLHDAIAIAQSAGGFAASTRPRSPRCVFSARSFRNRAFIVPLKPMCKCVISPSASVTVFTPAKVRRLNSPAVSSWPRLKRSLMIRGLDGQALSIAAVQVAISALASRHRRRAPRRSIALYAGPAAAARGYCLPRSEPTDKNPRGV